MMKQVLKTLSLSAVVALLVGLPCIGLAQEPVVHEKDAVVIKATIDGIDHDTRTISFKDKDGKTWDVVAGPEVRRFAELKIGDVVTFRTTESVVYQIRKPGEAAAPAAKDAAIVRTPGAKPGAVKTEQETKVVTIKDVNPKTMGVTIQTEDGKTMSMRVEDGKLLKGLAPGDRVVITYTKAVAINIE